MLEAGLESQIKLLKEGGEGEVKPEIVCRWERVLNELPPLPHARSLKNCNRIPIRLIKLCLMNDASGAKL